MQLRHTIITSLEANDFYMNGSKYTSF